MLSERCRRAPSAGGKQLWQINDLIRPCVAFWMRQSGHVIGCWCWRGQEDKINCNSVNCSPIFLKFGLLLTWETEHHIDEFTFSSCSYNNQPGYGLHFSLICCLTYRSCRRILFYRALRRCRDRKLQRILGSMKKLNKYLLIFRDLSFTKAMGESLWVSLHHVSDAML